MWANRVAVPNDNGGELTGRDHTNLTKAALCLVFARAASVGVKPTLRRLSCARAATEGTLGDPWISAVAGVLLTDHRLVSKP
jgi:hypothetical protein